MTAITSRQHPIVKEFRELARGGGPLMLLDGWHVLGEAVNAGIAVQTVAVCGPPTADEQTLIDRAVRANARIVAVSGSVLNALSPVNSPTGVVASARKPVADAASLLTPPPALVLAAFGVQDPGNSGALIRSASAAGATGVIVDEATADPWSWKAVRASMGSVFHLPVIRTRNPIVTLSQWKASGLSVIAAMPRGGTPMHDMDLTRPVAILLGGEGPGLSADVLEAADARISISMHGAVESLNVAVAAALILFEAKRQRAR